MASYGDDELIINHSDACIYGRDMALFEDSSAWLNDACLQYHLTCLQHQQPQTNGTVFLDPSVAFCLVHQLDEPEEFVQFARGNPEVWQARQVLVPINDSLAKTIGMADPSGLGTHWTLLLIRLPSNNRDDKSSSCCDYVHFDSSRHSGNIEAAEAVARQWNLLWKYIVHENIKSTATASIVADDKEDIVVHSAKTPLQSNGYDCGVHVLLAAEVLSQSQKDLSTLQCCEDELEEGLGAQLRQNPQLCQDLRHRIAQDIRQRADQEEKS